MFELFFRLFCYKVWMCQLLEVSMFENPQNKGDLFVLQRTLPGVQGLHLFLQEWSFEVHRDPWPLWGPFNTPISRNWHTEDVCQKKMKNNRYLANSAVQITSTLFGPCSFAIKKFLHKYLSTWFSVSFVKVHGTYEYLVSYMEDWCFKMFIPSTFAVYCCCFHKELSIFSGFV